jgi:hypothetical protein
VILENDEPSKIKDRGMVSLGNDRGDAKYVIPIDGLKHNLLNVSQICDRGCKEVVNSKDCKIKSVNSGQEVVNSKDCKIKSVNSGQEVAKIIRTDGKVDIESSPACKEEDPDTVKECSFSIYPMEEVKEESCHKMEAEVLKVENSNTQSKFLNNYMIVDNILDSQRSPNEKSGVGYNKEENNTHKKPDTSPSFVKKKSRYESGCSGFPCD